MIETCANTLTIARRRICDLMQRKGSYFIESKHLSSGGIDDDIDRLETEEIARGKTCQWCYLDIDRLCQYLVNYLTVCDTYDCVFFYFEEHLKWLWLCSYAKYYFILLLLSIGKSYGMRTQKCIQ
jgi:hypothetical protein